MAAGNCYVKFNCGQLPHIWVNGRLHASQEDPLLSRGHCMCRVEGSPHRKNQLDPLKCLATIHDRYRQPDGRTDRQRDLLWHGRDIHSRPKRE